MRAVRQMGSGIFYGLVSVLLVIGGLSLALAESYTAPSATPTVILPTVPQTLTSTQTGPTAPPSSTPWPTAPAPPTNCPPPAGWMLISVQPYDTLESLAERFNVAPYQLAQANCLFTNSLEPGFNIYVPPLPMSAPVSCGAPFGWVRTYVVQPGDSLYRIATLHGTSLSELQRANCLSTSFIAPGDLLWVPNVSPATPSVIILLVFGTPTPTASDTALPTNPPTLTSLPPSATNGPTATLLSVEHPSPTVPPASPTITAFPTSTP